MAGTYGADEEVQYSSSSDRAAGEGQTKTECPPNIYLNPYNVCIQTWDLSEGVTEERHMNNTRKSESGSDQWMFAYGSLLENQFDVWRLTIQQRPTFNRLHLLWDQTHLDYSPAAKLSTNKGNGTLHHPSLWKLASREKKTLQLFNKYKFIWSTDKEKWRAFFRPCTPYDSNLGVLCILAQACGLW